MASRSKENADFYSAIHSPQIAKRTSYITEISTARLSPLGLRHGASRRRELSNVMGNVKAP